MAYSITQYTADGVTTDWTFQFPYLDPAHVFARVGGVNLPLTIVAGSIARISPAVASGATITIYRNTTVDDVPVDFNDGSVLTERDLDRLALFCLYTAQESVDWAGYVDDAGNPGPLPGGFGSSIPDILEALTGQITESELSLALTQRIATIEALGITNGAAITSEATTRASADSALSSQITTLTAGVNGNAAAISAETTARANGDSALSSQITALQATVNGNTAAIQSESTTRASADSALASDITTLQSSVGANSAAISTEATTRATVDGHLSSLYTVRAQVTEGGRTVVGGFGLSGTSGGDAGPTIDFGVRADKFWIGAPAGTTGVGDVLPFVVQTSDQVVNGVTIPKGVYMDAAYIKNLTAMVARLGTAWIDSAMIGSVDAGTVTVGTLNVDRIANGAITDDFSFQSYSSTDVPINTTTVLAGVDVTQPAGSSWHGEVTFSGELYRAAYAGQSGVVLHVYARDTNSTWYQVGIYVHSFPSATNTMSALVSLNARWTSTLPVGVAVNRWEVRLVNGSVAVAGISKPHISVKTFKK